MRTYFYGTIRALHGASTHRQGAVPYINAHLASYFRITAATVDRTTFLLAGKPNFEAQVFGS
jgi:hypothetical protein